jgi:hypothetical protein
VFKDYDGLGLEFVASFGDEIFGSHPQAFTALTFCGASRGCANMFPPQYGADRTALNLAIHACGVILLTATWLLIRHEEGERPQPAKEGIP